MLGLGVKLWGNYGITVPTTLTAYAHALSQDKGRRETLRSRLCFRVPNPAWIRDPHGARALFLLHEQVLHSTGFFYEPESLLNPV